MNFLRVLVTVVLLVAPLWAVMPGGVRGGAGAKFRWLWLLLLLGLAAFGVWFLFSRSHREGTVIWHGWPAPRGGSVVVASEGPWWEGPERRQERVFVVFGRERIWPARLGTLRARYWSQEDQCLYVIRAVRSKRDGSRNLLSQLVPSSRKVLDLTEIIEVPETFAIVPRNETMVAMYRVPHKEFRLAAVRLGGPSDSQLICVADHYLYWQLMPGSGNVYFTTRATASTGSAGLWRVATWLGNAEPELVLQDVKGIPFAVDPSETYVAAPVRGGPFPGLRLFSLDGSHEPVTLSRVLPGELRPQLAWSSDGVRLAFVDVEALKVFVVQGQRVEVLVLNDKSPLPFPEIGSVTCLPNGDAYFVKDDSSFWQYRASDSKLRCLVHAGDLNAYFPGR